ncbi:MAG: hypothetical protein M1334_04295 [Patescibacteria group bacterium]|nr:hypothetical protein [Patescibacteria group bacterium]
MWFGLFILFIKYFKTEKIWDIFLISLAWPVFEFLRTYFYSWYPPILGKGDLIGAHMAFGVFGYSLADYYSLRQWAAIGGDYFLSFVLILINASIFYLLALCVKNRKLIRQPVDENFKSFIKKFYFKFIEVLFIIVVILLISILGGKYLNSLYFYPDGSINVAAIQLNFPIGVWSSFDYPNQVYDKIKSELNSAFSRKPTVDLAVIPEGGDFTQFSGANLKSIQNFLGINHYRVVVDGSYEQNQIKNYLAIFDNKDGFLGDYAKRFLMPFGEYPTALIKFPASIFYPDWLKDFSYRWYLPGDKVGVFQTQFGKVGTLACSEIISPELSRETANAGAQLITYSASDSIFRGSGELHAQNLAMAQIRATETRRAIIYASNGEKSFIISPTGNVLWAASNLDFQNGYAAVPLNSAFSLYDRFGNWFIYVSIFILMIFIVFLKARFIFGALIGKIKQWMSKK